MDPDRWKRIEPLLQSALDRPPEERIAYLRKACAGDETLEREVRSLVALEGPAANFLDRQLVDCLRDIASTF